MSYRCGICNDVTPKGMPRLFHTVEREVPKTSGPKGPGHKATRKEIAAEVSVCQICKGQLEMHSLGELLEWKRREEQYETKLVFTHVKEEETPEPVKPADPIERLKKHAEKSKTKAPPKKDLIVKRPQQSKRL
jgi:hypothetical protein